MKWFKGYWHWHDSHWDQRVFLFAGAFPPAEWFFADLRGREFVSQIWQRLRPFNRKVPKKKQDIQELWSEHVLVISWNLRFLLCKKSRGLSRWFFCGTESFSPCFKNQFPDFSRANFETFVSLNRSPVWRWTILQLGEIVKDERWEQKKGFNLKVASTA